MNEMEMLAEIAYEETINEQEYEEMMSWFILNEN